MLRSLVLACAVAACTGRPPSTAAPAAQMIGVGRTVQVSLAHALDTHYEVVVSAHPTDRTRLVVGSLIYPENGATWSSIAYSSTDGGGSWAPTLEGDVLSGSGDPATAYGPDGTAYYVASLIPPTGDRRLLLFRAADGGTKWDGPFLLTYMDREYVTVDATRGPNRGRVYVNGSNRVPQTIQDFVVWGSVDGGRTFRGPGTRAAFGSVRASAMGNAVVASNGTLVGVYAEAATRSAEAGAMGSAVRGSLASMISVDAGASVVAGGVIGPYIAGGERKGPLAGNANSEPALAIDATMGRYKDRLYVVWPDRGAGHSEILFAWSSDLGRTWSVPRAINDNLPDDRTDQFMPEIAVNKDGVVGVTWYDRRNHPDNLGWDVRFAASRDGGASFLPSVRVSEQGASFPPGTTRERPTPVQAADVASALRAQVKAGRDSFRFMGGDTAGLAADAAGVFHAVWVDNHTGSPQVWATSITVR